MRILVCGGRGYTDADAIRAAIVQAAPSLVITGGAEGADTLADREAEELGIPRVIFPANWIGEGRAAGPIRNARMLAEGRPDLVIAMPGERGTADMVRQARSAGVKVWQPALEAFAGA